MCQERDNMERSMRSKYIGYPVLKADGRCFHTSWIQPRAFTVVNVANQAAYCGLAMLPCLEISCSLAMSCRPELRLHIDCHCHQGLLFPKHLPSVCWNFFRLASCFLRAGSSSQMLVGSQPLFGKFCPFPTGNS